MHSPPKPADEPARQATVDQILLAHPELEQAFDLVTHIITTRLNVPMSTFTLVDRDRLYFPSRQGLDVSEVSRDTGFCAYAILSEEIFVVGDARHHKDFMDDPLVAGPTAMNFYAGVPVHAPNGHRVGTLSAIDTHPRELTEDMRETLLDLRGIVESLIRLLSLSIHDHLTGLFNRRHFDKILDQEWHRACRAELPIALLTIDIDYFKSFNDTFGHPAGDECLCRIASSLAQVCKRSGDLPFRIGGEEFAVLLSMTSDERGTIQFATELHEAFHSLAIPNKKSPFKIVTVSIGIAYAATDNLPKDGSGLERFISKSDAALYAAKVEGRNRTVVRHF